MPTNCWTFSAPYGESRMEVSGAFYAKRSHRTGEPQFNVSVRSGHFGYDIRVADNDLAQIMPGDAYWVFTADIGEADETTLPDQASYELVPHETDCDVTLLLVKSDSGVESFDLFSKPHFNDCRVWVGADGDGLKLQGGTHQSPFKKQLFQLHEGESILFFDALKEVTKITAGAFGERPTCIRATEGEVADYVLGEAKKRGDNPSSRAWCFYALQELGCQRQLDEFGRMFPSFHRK